MIVVYKITREDGLEYVGTAVNLKNRIAAHKGTDRFKVHGIKHVDILGEFNQYNEALSFEHRMVEQFDTFRNGLNNTPTGTGWSNTPKFTTKGLKFSNNTKANIGRKSKERNAGVVLNEWYSSSTANKNKRLDAIRKARQLKIGKPGPTKYSYEQVEQLLLLYKTKPPIETKFYDRVFCRLHSMKFGIKAPAAYKIITGNVLAWNSLREQILNA